AATNDPASSVILGKPRVTDPAGTGVGQESTVTFSLAAPADVDPIATVPGNVAAFGATVTDANAVVGGSYVAVYDGVSDTYSVSRDGEDLGSFAPADLADAIPGIDVTVTGTLTDG